MTLHEPQGAAPPPAPSLAEASADPAAIRAQNVLIGLIFLATALNYVDRQVLALLKPMLEAEFNWTDQQFAHLGSIFQLAAAASLLGVGWFVDRFGVRFAYGFAVAVWSLAGMAHALAASVQQFVIARAVLATAESVNTPAAMKTAAIYLPIQRRSIGIGIINTAPNIGAIITPLLIPPFAIAFGWKAAFLVTGALGLLWLAAWHFNTAKLKPIAGQTATTRGKVEWGVILSDRRTWTVIGAKAFTDLVWWFVLFWTPDFFSRQFSLSQGALGWPIAIIFTLAALGAVSSGALYPALLLRGLSVNAARKSAMLAFALIVLVMPLALIASNPWVAAICIGMGLFAHQGFSTNIFGMATEIIPSRRIATVIALGAIGGNLTGTGIIEFAGWSLDSGLGYGPLFVVCGSAYLVALAFIHLMQPKLATATD
ncbi:MFS transporter [Novosphingobium sp. P6W]|uniref:MFS transporter n=1 Tax=Novosphingobium sp. P6W TaxID=1609758 RepID=UPI0005C66EA6|nr:MFS transporter [Novosphingobium sp. P6W]AXB78413.1 MFS transporter [Novosphingobium sp. P6W]